MTENFGADQAETLARDTVITELGSRTMHQALAAGVPAKDVWRAVCEAMDVPVSRR